MMAGYMRNGGRGMAGAAAATISGVGGGCGRVGTGEAGYDASGVGSMPAGAWRRSFEGPDSVDGEVGRRLAVGRAAAGAGSRSDWPRNGGKLKGAVGSGGRRIYPDEEFAHRLEEELASEVACGLEVEEVGGEVAWFCCCH
ncbi:hypothetical protein E2562_002492 [Oryza meyeriana var. granulata]|uniref:DUF834 domain-containing protein n=1 Tax=Oryza meyeriana var. granulata TaxID=110450 RepID=A0A6G1F2N7_9ORYZ|nr:hypothetical protein E2562_011828 [Oryza meyeriana var. granulata]KAF0931133.1 hypothetical protein E2562_002492 [Oryza meyeriana var. granulata]